MKPRRVVVTGLGALTPIGNSISEYWDGLISGKSGAAPITYFDTENFKTKFACELKNFDPLDHMDRKEMRKNDRFSQYAIVAAEEAINDSNLNLDKINKDRVGVIWGAGIGGLETFQNEVLGFAENNFIPRFNPFFIPKLIADIAPGLISIKYGFTGPNFATVSACASSSNAIIDALNYIRLGYSDIILSGGSEAGVTIAGIGGFNAMHALSTRNDDPKTASRPFDKERDGFVMGEGAGVLVLEELEYAKKRGANIYAEIIGYGMSGDAFHITSPEENGDGGYRSMQECLKMAKINPDQIDYINAHGTSTQLGDDIELKAIMNLINGSKNTKISSTKSSIGHLLGAAGSVESVFSIMAIKENKVPATLNLENPSHEYDVDLIPKFPKDHKVNIALSNSFGFGGTNTALLFKSY